MNRKDLQILAAKRLAEAKTLFRAGHYEGAYHLSGVSVECAIKACVAKQTKRHDFPDKSRVAMAFTHDLQGLITLAHLQEALRDASVADAAFGARWNVVKEWRIESRYTPVVKKQEANAILSAVADEREGVMAWLQRHW